MPPKNIFSFIIIIIGSSCFSQEKMRVDLDGPATKTQPAATKGSGMAGDHTHRNSVWRVDLFPSAPSPDKFLTLEIHIVNISPVQRKLPLSQDGAKLVAACTDRTILQGVYFLGSKADNNYFRRLANFYGCEASPGTLTELQPGEWVTYLMKIQTAQLPRELRVGFSLVHTRYRPGPDGRTAEGLDTVLEYSPSVQIPEGPFEGHSGDTIHNSTSAESGHVR